MPIHTMLNSTLRIKIEYKANTDGPETSEFYKLHSTGEFVKSTPCYVYFLLVAVSIAAGHCACYLSFFKWHQYNVNIPGRPS